MPYPSKNPELKEKNKKIKYMVQLLVDKCQFIQESEIIRGKQKVTGRYLLLDDIELVLRELF